MASSLLARRGLIFIDAVFNVNRFKVDFGDLCWGGRIFHCLADVATHQKAELDCLVHGLRFIVNVGWPVFKMAGDNAALIN